MEFQNSIDVRMVDPEYKSMRIYIDMVCIPQTSSQATRGKIHVVKCHLQHSFVEQGQVRSFGERGSSPS